MIYSTGTGYALRFLAALSEDGRYIHSKDMAQRLGLPWPYLLKVLKPLAKGGVLDSIRGRHGGYRLARKAHLITVNEVVRLLNHAEVESECWMGCIPCGKPAHLCPLLGSWLEARAKLNHITSLVTIRDLQGCFQTGTLLSAQPAAQAIGL